MLIVAQNTLCQDKTPNDQNQVITNLNGSATYCESKLRLSLLVKRTLKLEYKMRGGGMIVILALTMVVLPCSGYGVRVRVENSTVTTDHFIDNQHFRDDNV